MSKSLTERQILFIDNFTGQCGGNATQSAIKAGYSDKTAKQQGYALKKQLSLEIEEKNRELLNNNVPLAITTLRALIEDSKVSASVRLGAINSVLDRNNYSGVTKIEDVTHNKTDEQLKVELEHLLSTIDTPVIKIDLDNKEEDIKH
jgi:phage terminase small subunit